VSAMRLPAVSELVESICRCSLCAQTTVVWIARVDVLA
jgi:hypothetical protein